MIRMKSWVAAVHKETAAHYVPHLRAAIRHPALSPSISSGSGPAICRLFCIDTAFDAPKIGQNTSVSIG